jgi:hypothetical protein
MTTRIIFGLKREAVKGDWIKLPKEELCNLHSSSIIIIVIRRKDMRGLGDMACVGRNRKDTEGKNILGRLRHRWAGDITTDFEKWMKEHGLD